MSFTTYITTTLVKSLTTGRDNLGGRAAGVGSLTHDKAEGHTLRNTTLTVDLSDLPSDTAKVVYIETDNEVTVTVNGGAIKVNNHLLLADVEVTSLTIMEGDTADANVWFYVAGG